MEDVMQELQEMKEQHEDWRSIALEALSANQALQTQNKEIKRKADDTQATLRRLEEEDGTPCEKFPSSNVDQRRSRCRMMQDVYKNPDRFNGVSVRVFEPDERMVVVAFYRSEGNHGKEEIMREEGHEFQFGIQTDHQILSPTKAKLE
ncbi:hypothetical protein JHK82_050211 [Glycine max]|nr:hypothetical protein JHK82_050211 [Glycine max]